MSPLQRLRQLSFSREDVIYGKTSNIEKQYGWCDLSRTRHCYPTLVAALKAARIPVSQSLSLRFLHVLLPKWTTNGLIPISVTEDHLIVRYCQVYTLV